MNSAEAHQEIQRSLQPPTPDTVFRPITQLSPIQPDGMRIARLACGHSRFSRDEEHQVGDSLICPLCSNWRDTPPPDPTIPASSTTPAITLAQRCEATWNTCYPDRRPWSQIGAEAQQEWLRVFQVFQSQFFHDISVAKPAHLSMPLRKVIARATHRSGDGKTLLLLDCSHYRTWHPDNGDAPSLIPCPHCPRI